MSTKRIYFSYRYVHCLQICYSIYRHTSQLNWRFTLFGVNPIRRLHIQYGRKVFKLFNPTFLGRLLLPNFLRCTHVTRPVEKMNTYFGACNCPISFFKKKSISDQIESNSVETDLSALLLGAYFFRKVENHLPVIVTFSRCVEAWCSARHPFSFSPFVCAGDRRGERPGRLIFALDEEQFRAFFSFSIRPTESRNISGLASLWQRHCWYNIEKSIMLGILHVVVHRLYVAAHRMQIDWG